MFMMLQFGRSLAIEWAGGVNGEWVYYSELNFTSKAKPGHLPGGTVFGWEGGVLCGVLGLGGIWFLLSRRDL